MLIAVSLGWQSKWCQIKNINVDVQVDRSPFISPLSLSISLNNNNSHSFSLSLQFQAYARFDRNKLNLIRRYLHSLHSLSLSSSSAFTALPISLSHTNHTERTDATGRNSYIRSLFDLLVYSRYTYTRVEQSVLSRNFEMHGFKGAVTCFDIQPISSCILALRKSPLC